MNSPNGLGAGTANSVEYSSRCLECAFLNGAAASRVSTGAFARQDRAGDRHATYFAIEG